MNHPAKLTCIRHGQSTLNSWHEQLHNEKLYRQFLIEYDKNPDSPRVQFLAQRFKGKYGSFIADHESRLTFTGRKQPRGTSYALRATNELPDVIYVSPYKRTLETLEQMQKVWPELRNVPVIRDLKIREQEIGEIALYGDFKVFFALNPEQRKLHNLQDIYYYRFPNGENVPDILQRQEMWFQNICNKHAGENVMMISHFITILSLRAFIENWDDKRFLNEHRTIDNINCAVTQYKDVSGKFKLTSFNQKLW
ncbi:MAG: histidine phosphatase family protein [Candidatus Spechtbacterales bacterium]